MEFLKRREALKKALDVAQTDVRNYGSVLETYSSFPKGKMLNVLVEILTTLEGVQFRFNVEEQYFCQSMVYDDKRGTVKFDIDFLVSLGKVIRLNEKYFLFNTIRFYSLLTNGNFEVAPSFLGYEYLEEFINRVISYRFENEVKKISDSELEILKNQFILRKLGEKRDALINLIDGVNKKLTSPEGQAN